MKKNAFCILAAFAISALSFSDSAAQSVNFPPPSPSQTVKQQFATSFIEISYARPGVKDRNVFGDLVPYGKVWRTGANAATTLKFGEEVNVNGTKLPAGKYGLLSIPGEKEWTIILSKDTTVTSPSAYKQENDAVRFTVKPSSLSQAVESFTIDVQNLKANAAEIRISWDKTQVSFTVSADIEGKIMAQIDEAMKGEKKPYFQSAAYYYENGKDLNKAHEWITEAVKAQPDAFWVLHLKAKIEYKQNRYDEAIATAKLSADKAKAAQNDDYVKMNEKLINDAQKHKTPKK